MSEATYLACCWPFGKTPSIPHWYQRGRAQTKGPNPVAPLQPCCGKTRQSNRLSSILIVQSRISGNLLSSLFIYILQFAQCQHINNLEGMTMEELQDRLQYVRIQKADLRKQAKGLRKVHLWDCLMDSLEKKQKNARQPLSRQSIEK